MRRLGSFPRPRNLRQSFRAQYVHRDVYQGREDGPLSHVGEEGEEREEKRGLVVDAAIVRPDIVVIEKETFLYCSRIEVSMLFRRCKKECELGGLHLLKLVTGVEISTRSVNKSGKPGDKEKRASRRRTAPRNTPAFSLDIIVIGMPAPCSTHRVCVHVQEVSGGSWRVEAEHEATCRLSDGAGT